MIQERVYNMKTGVVIGIMAVLLVGGAMAGQAYQPFKFLETEDLSVLDDAMIGDVLRVNGLLDIDGNVVYENPCSGWADLQINDYGMLVFVCLES